MQLNFIIIWAAKSWTTWLANMLRQHPDIFIPEEKELHYFNKQYAADPSIENINQKRGIERYKNFFKKANENQIKWEATPAYLWDKMAVHNIYKYNPNIKLIAILRNPVEKIYSSYLYRVQRWVSSSKNVLEDIEKNSSLIENALYYKHIKKYLKIFSKEKNAKEKK